MRAAKKAAPPSIPTLYPCRTCGLHLQKGKGPGGLAWHTPCEPPTGLDEALRSGEPLDQAKVEELLLRELLLQVRRETATPQDALQALAGLRKATAATLPKVKPTPAGADDPPSDAFVRWLGALPVKG